MKIEDFISVDKVNYDGHFKHIATGAFQYVLPPIESMFRENAVIYFFRWLEMNGMDLEADYNDDDKMAEYGEGFAKYIASGKITLAVPPEPERIYVTLGQANLPSSGGPSRMMDEVLSNLSDDATLGGISQTGAFTDPGNLPRNPSGRASPLHGAGSERLGSRTAASPDLARMIDELNRGGAQNAVDLLAPAGRDSNLFPSNRDTYSARSAPVGISQRHKGEAREAARDLRIQALEDRMTRNSNALIACSEGAAMARKEACMAKNEAAMMAGKLQRGEAKMARMTEILNALYKDFTSRPADPPPKVKPAERENQQFFFSQPPSTTAYQPSTYALPGRQVPAPGLDRAHSASQPPHPGNSPLQGNFCHTPEKAALVAAEVKATLAARGGSTNNLFGAWETANHQAIIMTTDLVTGSASEAADGLSELKFLHAPEHGVMIDGKGMPDIDSLRDHTDSAQQLAPFYANELAENMQIEDNKLYGDSHFLAEYKEHQFVKDYQRYLNSYINLLQALETLNRDLKETTEAWKVVKVITAQLKDVRRRAAGRMGGISGDHSTKVKAQNRVTLYRVTAEFMSGLVGSDGHIITEPSPLWMKASLRIAEDAQLEARMNKVQVRNGRRQSVVPPPAPSGSSKITWKKSIGIVKGVFAHGLTGSQSPLTVLKPDSTHKHKDFGCPGCTSRLHHHSECPAGHLTRKEAATALIALGRINANAAALTAAGTNVTEFEAAVNTIYN